MNIVRIIGIEDIPIIKAGDNVAKLVCATGEGRRAPIQNGYILVITHVAGLVRREEYQT